jgi:hypothetical protein
MFDRFLKLYQLVFLMMLTSSLYLICTLRFRHELKIVLLTYFKVYCCYKCSELCLVIALMMSVVLMRV